MSSLKYLVVMAYARPPYEKGEIVSRHKTQKRAERAAKKFDPSGTWTAIEYRENEPEHDDAAAYFDWIAECRVQAEEAGQYILE